MSKVCTRCGVEKEFDEFSSNTSRTDGLDSWCKDCRNVVNAIRYHGLGIGRSKFSQAVTNKARIRSKRQAEITKYGIDMVETMESLGSY